MPDREGAHDPYAAATSFRPSSVVTAVGLDSPAIMTAPVAAYAVDPTGRICLWNDAIAEMSGWRADEVLGELPPFIDAEELGRALDTLERALQGGPVVQEEWEPHHRDGHRFRVVTSTTMLRDRAGAPLAAITLVRDVTEEHDATTRLRAAEHKWRQLAMRVTDTITIADVSGHVRESTGEIKPALGYPKDWWRGKSGFELLHPDDLARAADAWADVASTPGHKRREVFRARHFEGHYEQVEFTGVNLLDDPVINGIVVANRNVSVEKQAEVLLQDEARVFELIARDAPVDEILPEIVRIVEYHSGASTCLLLIDEANGRNELRVTGSVPPAVVDLLHRTRIGLVPRAVDVPEGGDTGDAADGSPHMHFTWRQPVTITDVPGDPRAAGYADVLTAEGFGAVWTVPIIETRTDTLYGLLITYARSSRPPTAHERKVAEVAGHLAAIAVERAGWQERLWQQARYDVLTGLPNRALIFETLDLAMNEARRRREPVVVMMVDLDRFKLINDSLGHAVGDQLIKDFAERLVNVLAEAFVGRMGADEFVVVFPTGVGGDDGRIAANRITAMLDDPFVVDDERIYLRSSIGLAVSLAGRENANTLLQQADAAMFHAKELGRDRVEVFDERLRTRAVARLEVDRDLRLAVERGELLLYYQPEVDCRDGRIVGAEALLRWEHPTRGLISPDGFIHVAEETGIIVPIGYWVLDEAVRQARVWTDAHPDIEPFTVSVNLSARQLINRSLVDTVAFVLTRYNWPPSHLTLELTESILIEDRDATLYVLSRLRVLGVKLAIDDFGTGFASLDYLHRLHVDTIKIDRSFVSMLQADGSGSPVATAMMHMATAFDVTVTAEGVEELHQFEGLKALGCDLAQGFLFAKPLPPDDFDDLIRSGRSW